MLYKKQNIQTQTLTKTELLKLLGIGESKLKKLIAYNPSFPKPIPILEKWSKLEVYRARKEEE